MVVHVGRNNSTSFIPSSRSSQSSATHSFSSYKSSGYGDGFEFDPELEELAEAFQARLLSEGRLKERQSMLFKKKIPNAFVGSDAVTILRQVLLETRQQRRSNSKLQISPSSSDSEEEDAPTVSREEALEKGCQIAEQFSFFQHATNAEKSLQDSLSDFYQFHNNLPTAVMAMKKKYKSPWDKMRLMEEYIDCKDRWCFPRVFPDCFVAKDAIDKLMELKLVRSRGEAVHLVQHLNQKVFCCQHVTSEHEFKDGYLFFRFVPKNERMPEPSKRMPSPKRSKSPKRKKDKMAKDGKEGQRNLLDEDADALFHASSSHVSNSSIKAKSKKRLSHSHHQKQNRKRANDIRSRLASHHQLRIQTNQMKS